MRIKHYPLYLILSFILLYSGANAQQYILIGWNDLGMHCANKDFSKMMILPPANNIFAQLIRKNGDPRIVTTGYTIEYSIPGNTKSTTKTNFWDYAQQLLGLTQPLTANIGLKGKGLTGTLDIEGNRFAAYAIPVTPYSDDDLNNEKPFQLIHLVAKSTSDPNTILATTDVVIPVSNEIGCVKSGCHSSEQSIIDGHPAVHNFDKTKPILCGQCHPQFPLGLTSGTAGSLSYRIHNKHKNFITANSVDACYNCHPGPKTQCLRDIMHNKYGKICQDCHGDLTNMASTISSGRRPWQDEPKCGDTKCHGTQFAEQSGKLFKDSQGHHGVYCEACHGSPHAILTSSQQNDNLQVLKLQGFYGTLRKCSVCHGETPDDAGPHNLSANDPRITTNVYYSEDDNILNLSNYPNPFSSSTSIEYYVPEPGRVKITIIDLYGNTIQKLYDDVQASGQHEILFDAGQLEKKISSGMYYYKVETRNYKSMKKMVFVN